MKFNTKRVISGFLAALTIGHISDSATAGFGGWQWKWEAAVLRISKGFAGCRWSGHCKRPGDWNGMLLLILRRTLAILKSRIVRKWLLKKPWMIRSVCKKFNNLCFCKAHEQGINVFFDSTLLEKGCKSMRFFCRIFITGYNDSWWIEVIIQCLLFCEEIPDWR